MNLLVALTVLAATTIQAWTSAIELGRANRPAAEWMGAEDDLVAGERRLRRRRARRTLKAERPPDLHREIRRIEWTLASWVTLMGAAAATVVDAVLR